MILGAVQHSHLTQGAVKSGGEWRFMIMIHDDNRDNDSW